MDDTATKRKGGRPPGSRNKRTIEMIEQAQQSGNLPHEILLFVAQGHSLPKYHRNPVTGELVQEWEAPADLATRIQAARDAAPYYAPKLQTVEVLQGLTDDNLDSLITQLAAEAGVSLVADGEEQADEAPAEDTGSSRPRRRIRLDG